MHMKEKVSLNIEYFFIIISSDEINSSVSDTPSHYNNT